jgi:ribose transport system permease protein
MTDHSLIDQPVSMKASILARVPGVAFMLVLLFVAFATTSPGFTTLANLSNVVVQSTILLIIALPMTLIIMTEGLDLSVGAVLTLTSIIFASVLLSTGSYAVAFAASSAVGIMFGAANGWLVAVPRIPPFVATLGTLSVAQGLCLIVTDGQSIVGLPPQLQWLYAGTILGAPVPLVMAALAYFAFHGVLYHTRFGAYVPALGGNRAALRQAGVNDSLVLVAVYTLGGFMAGLAAMLLTARMNAAHPTAAIGMEFDAIAAVAVGGTQFERGNGWLFGTLLGVVTIGILRNGLNLLAIPSSVQVSCVGLLVILALFVDGLRSKEE